MKFRVYCDQGGFNKVFSQLETGGLIELFTYPYEEKNKRIKNRALPSKMRFVDMIEPWGENFYPWGEYVGSEKFDDIFSKLYKKDPVHWKDALHLDSAHKSGCQFFITSDKPDIFNRKVEIKEFLGLEVYYHQELSDLITKIKQNNI